MYQKIFIVSYKHHKIINLFNKKALNILVHNSYNKEIFKRLNNHLINKNLQKDILQIKNLNQNKFAKKKVNKKLAIMN